MDVAVRHSDEREEGSDGDVGFARRIGLLVLAVVSMLLVLVPAAVLGHGGQDVPMFEFPHASCS